MARGFDIQVMELLDLLHIIAFHDRLCHIAVVHKKPPG